jgi:hypothetical protein
LSLKGDATVTRTCRAALVAALATLAVTPTGCSNSSRPPGVAVRQGDCFVELSDLQADFIGNNLQMKVHYRFPDRPPHPDAWFAFSFQVQAGATSAVTVRKQGRDLSYEGDITANQSSSFVRRQAVVTVRVRQATAAEGQYGDVSDTLRVEF